MTSFSVAEAKNNLSKLIDLTLSGDTVTITRHGSPVVELRRAQATPRPMTIEALAQLRAAREKLNVTPGEDFGTLVSRMRDEEWQGR
jgi:antitoxin (DNA-binding transcriptional repressor) of toxin-antitoxin stability system